MCDRTDTKYNRFSPQNERLFRCLGPVVALILTAVMVVFGAARPAEARTLPSARTDAAAAEGWTDVLLFWLELWANYMRCNPPYGNQPAAWLEDFNSCYRSRGIPGNLTEAERFAMLSTLDSLQAHLLDNPGVVDQSLINKTLGTIEQARADLSVPTPAPTPSPSLKPAMPLGHQDGR